MTLSSRIPRSCQNEKSAKSEFLPSIIGGELFVSFLSGICPERVRFDGGAYDMIWANREAVRICTINFSRMDIRSMGSSR